MMTTAFTAMPAKMTMSAMRFPDAMTPGSYAIRRRVSIGGGTANAERGERGDG